MITVGLYNIHAKKKKKAKQSKQVLTNPHLSMKSENSLNLIYQYSFLLSSFYFSADIKEQTMYCIHTYNTRDCTLCPVCSALVNSLEQSNYGSTVIHGFSSREILSVQ